MLLPLRAGRDPADVSLLAVSKGRTYEEVRELYDAGQRLFGENRPQGLRDRMAADLPDGHRVALRRQRPAASDQADRAVDRPAALVRPDPIGRAVGGVGAPSTGADRGQSRGRAAEARLRRRAAVRGAADLLVERGILLRGLMIIPPRVDVAEDATTVVRQASRARRGRCDPITRRPRSSRWA